MKDPFDFTPIKHINAINILIVVFENNTISLNVYLLMWGSAKKLCLILKARGEGRAQGPQFCKVESFSELPATLRSSESKSREVILTDLILIFLLLKRELCFVL